VTASKRRSRRRSALACSRISVHQLGAEDALGEAGVVLDVGGDGELAARAGALEHERREVGAGGVERGGVAGRAGTMTALLQVVQRAKGPSGLLQVEEYLAHRGAGPIESQAGPGGVEGA
jgi:hypothetical protein